MKEVWKSVPKYEGYIEVSNLGNARSVKITSKGNIIKLPLTKDLGSRKDYYYIRIHNSKLNLNTRVRLHRLIAETFLENPNNYPYVNHKDENKLNNSVDNLEWCTAKYNINYGNSLEKRAYNSRNQSHRSRKILQLDLEGNIIREFPSFKEAQRCIGHGYSNIWSCCNGRCEAAYGYKWKYKE